MLRYLKFLANSFFGNHIACTKMLFYSCQTVLALALPLKEWQRMMWRQTGCNVPRVQFNFGSLLNCLLCVDTTRGISCS